MNESVLRPLRARLHHIALESPDPSALATFYSDAMGMRMVRVSDGLLGQARDRQIYLVPGRAKTLAFAAFAVQHREELDVLQERLRSSGAPIAVRTDGTDLLESGALSTSDPDGNRLLFGVPRQAGEVVGSGLPARLQHFVVASRDASRLSAFYQRALGLTLSDNVLDDAGELRTAFLRCSEEHHSFAVFQASSDRFDHHCYEAGEWSLIRDWGDHFAARQIPIAWGPGRHGPGNNLFMFVHDPDGNWLEISAELEVVPPDRPVGQWKHEQRTLNRWGTAPLRS